MRFVLKPWNPKAEVRKYLTSTDDFVPVFVVIAKGFEKGVMMEHHYLSDSEHLERVQQSAKLYENWSITVVSIGDYLLQHWGVLTVE